MRERFMECSDDPKKPTTLNFRVHRLPAIIARPGIIGNARAHVVPALIAAAGERASLRFLEFFAANIRNPHTRRAYSRAVAEFMAWCDDNGRDIDHGRAAASRLGLDRAADAGSMRPRPPSCAWRRCAICSTGW